MPNTKNSEENQELKRRLPKQARALYKVELIFEAAMRLIDEGGIEALSTNAVAQTAGVSIGTLYQYFDSKTALLDALVQREVEAIMARVKKGMDKDMPHEKGERIRAIMKAVLAAYGGRNKVHRRLIEYGMSRGRTGGLGPLYAEMIAALKGGVSTPDHKRIALSETEAFVLTYAIAGVLRGIISAGDKMHSKQDIEDALVRLALGFVDQ